MDKDREALLLECWVRVIIARAKCWARQTLAGAEHPFYLYGHGAPKDEVSSPKVSAPKAAARKRSR